MGSLVPDQQQAQVPVAVEGAYEPHEELANSTSGAAYELETSGDGEARQRSLDYLLSTNTELSPYWIISN